MPTPKILLIPRKAVEEKNPELLSYLETVPPAMAIVQCDADHEAAKDLGLTAIATFNSTTAIIADFAAMLVVNDDGSTEPVVLPGMLEPEPEKPLIELVE